MSAVEIVQWSRQHYDNTGGYYSAEARCGKHSVLVVVADGISRFGRGRPYVRVCVQNASNRAWRGMGNEYANEAAAVEHFRTAEVKAIIQAVCAAAREVQ